MHLFRFSYRALGLCILGCTTPEIIACPSVPYTVEDIQECDCGTVSTPGVLSAIVAGPGSFRGGAPVAVSSGGASLASGTTGPDGSLALLVPRVPRLGEVTFDVRVDRQTYVVTAHAPTPEASIDNATDLAFVQDESGVLLLEGTVRTAEVIDCPSPFTPTSETARIYAANLTTGETTLTPAPGIDQPFDVEVEGAEGDIAIIAVVHENGGVSGCFFPEPHRFCCSCPAGEGRRSPFRGARCSDEMRARGGCVTRGDGPDAGTDAGSDDAGVDAGPADAGLGDAGDAGDSGIVLSDGGPF